MEAREYLTLFRHMEWADSLTWRKVAALRDEQFDARLGDLLYHLHTVQWVYLQVWREHPPKVPSRDTFPTLSATLSWARAYYTELHVFIKGLSRETLGQTLAIPWVAEVAKRYGSAEPTTLADTVLQVVLHSTYHRGQVATRIKELGAAPDVTDFIAWVWMKQPEPTW